MKNTLDFYRGKRVFVTGHTGFKGTWLCALLLRAGANVAGYALPPPTNPNMWDMLGMGAEMESIVGDIRDPDALSHAFASAAPEIVIHMAAQPIVRESYRDPAGTYSTNVMGTVHVLECARRASNVRSILNVTTDKVYRNKEWHWGYREDDALDGRDPYSNSKSCSELVSSSYRLSFFRDMGVRLSTARSGNVIGGGDYAADRIVPDCVRAAQAGQPLIVRNPHSIRPYQHVLEPLSAYLQIAAAQCDRPDLEGAYNVGPDEAGCVSTGELADLFCAAWGEEMRWENRHDGGPHEASFLRLDISKICAQLGWRPVWGIAQAVEKTVEWEKIRLQKGDLRSVTSAQIEEYFFQPQG